MTSFNTKTILSSLLFFISTTTMANTLEFTISGIKSAQGKIYIQLFSGEHNYKNNKAHLSSIAIAKKGSITVTFNDLEASDYAIRYFHDENENASLETNLFGMPTEGYGYSNNAKANYGPVSYQQMQFHLTNDIHKNSSTVTY